jgi:hypothetical protein
MAASLPDYPLEALLADAADLLGAQLGRSQS